MHFCSKCLQMTAKIHQERQCWKVSLINLSLRERKSLVNAAIIENRSDQKCFSELVNVSSTSSKRIKVLEQDLRQTLETVEQLQKEKKNAGKLEKQCDQLRRELSELRQAKIDEQTRFENGILSTFCLVKRDARDNVLIIVLSEYEKLQAQYVSLQALKSEVDHTSEHATDGDREKEEENDRLKATITALNDEIIFLKAEVKSLEDTIKEIQKLPSNGSQDKLEVDNSTIDQRLVGPLSPNPTQTVSPTPTSGSVYGASKT